jgi:hypothetical protein
MADPLIRLARRRLLISLGVAAAVTVVLLLAIGPAGRCDVTPPCPPGQFCTAVKIIGPCRLSGGAVAIACATGTVAGAAMYLRRR